MAKPLSNSTTPCPKPFIRQSTFPPTGGYVDGRLCYDWLDTSCCIPCPFTDWTYSDGFDQRAEIGNWINLAALFATAFLLLSFICLDKKWTHKHYLSICLAIGVFFIELAFIIPLFSRPEQCHDDITPNGMASDITCALSGSCLLFGGWAAVIWVFWRALSIHLQICWEVVPGPKFFYSALVLGWGIPATGLAIVLSLTGVSYRFGNVCHINHERGLGDFWIPLLTVAAVALILQFVTIFYCVHIFVRNMLRDRASNGHKSDLPSIVGSFNSNSARQTYRRVKRVVQLQWRGASVVLLIIAQVTFFSVVFVSMDNNTSIQPGTPAGTNALLWANCLIKVNGDADQCLDFAAKLVTSEGVTLAVLICLGLSGFWCLLFLGRWSMVLGWRDLVRRRMLQREENALAGARSADERTYEMLDSKRSGAGFDLQTRSHASLHVDAPRGVTPMTTELKAPDDYFGRKPLINVGVAISTDSNPDTPRAPSQTYGLHRSRSSSPLGHSAPGTTFAKDYAR